MIDRKDLQVDDLVMYLNHPYRIIELLKNKATIRDMYFSEEGLIDTEINEYVSYDKLEPIELTEDVITLNGWKKRSYTTVTETQRMEEITVWEQEGFPSIGKIDNGSFKYTLAMPLYWVHDLQHLIKACKVNKLIII
jgi:hypothetical protein